jgi:hypothetical protein
MEANYLDIEVLVQQARQQRSQAVGEMLAAGWKKCKELFSANAIGQTIVWRTLPP